MWQEVTSRRAGRRRRMNNAASAWDEGELAAEQEASGDDLSLATEAAPEALYSRTPSPANSPPGGRQPRASSAWQAFCASQGLPAFPASHSAEEVAPAAPVAWFMPVAMPATMLAQPVAMNVHAQGPEAATRSERCSACEQMSAAQAALSERVADLEAENARLRVKVSMEPEFLRCRLDELQEECQFLRQQLAKALEPQQAPSRQSVVLRSAVALSRDSSAHSTTPATDRSRRGAWESLLHRRKDEGQQQQRCHSQQSDRPGARQPEENARSAVVAHDVAQPQEEVDHLEDGVQQTHCVSASPVDESVTCSAPAEDKQEHEAVASLATSEGVANPAASTKSVRRARRRATKKAEKLTLHAESRTDCSPETPASTLASVSILGDAPAAESNTSEGKSSIPSQGPDFAAAETTAPALPASNDVQDNTTSTVDSCVFLGYWNPFKGAASSALTSKDGSSAAEVYPPMRLAWEERRQAEASGKPSLDHGYGDLRPATHFNIGLTDRSNPLLQMPAAGAKSSWSSGAASNPSKGTRTPGIKEITVAREYQVQGAGRSLPSPSQRCGNPSGPCSGIAPSQTSEVGMKSSALAEATSRGDAMPDKATRSNVLGSVDPCVFGTYTTCLASTRLPRRAEQALGGAPVTRHHAERKR